MWTISFVSACVAITVVTCAISDGTNVFLKCCSKNQNLVNVSDEESNTNFKCMSTENITQMYNITTFPLVLDDSINVSYGIPDGCDEIRMNELLNAELTSSMSTNQCYDRLAVEIANDTVIHHIPKNIILNCINNEVNDIKTYDANVKLSHFRKCCPIGQGYDAEYHLCRDTEENDVHELLAKLRKQDRNNIYEIEKGLLCKYSESAVEITEQKFDLELDGSVLRVLDKNGYLQEQFPEGQWCADYDYKGGSIVARVCTKDCKTFDAFCLRKCCPIGQHFVRKKCTGNSASICVPNKDDAVLYDLSYYMDPLKQRDNDFGDVLGFSTDLRCPAGKFMLNNTVPKDRHNLTVDGVIESITFDSTEFCLESFDMRPCGGRVHVTGVFCFVGAPVQKDFTISFVLNSLSAVCLALTLVVYCSLSELRNLHGRTLICHVATMLLAYSCLARVQYGLVSDKRVCTTLGYGIYFGFVAAFAWLNVMCVDIWWTFGSVRTVQSLRKASTERRRFAWYSLYAWSVAVLLTIAMLLLDLYPIAHFLDANMGTGMCWFGSNQNTETDWPHYIFFVVPMGLVTCTNFVLWVLTARHCARVKSEVHRLQAGSVGERAKKRFRVDRAKYILTGKLWVVMGAGWVCELLSTLTTEPKWLWFIVDLINELQGVFIFLILVFKPKVYRLIRNKLGLKPAQTQNNGTASSARTSSTFLSRTISSDANARISLPIKQN